MAGGELRVAAALLDGGFDAGRSGNPPRPSEKGGERSGAEGRGIYPLTGHRAAGASLWDVDGNEYLDLTIGFGSLLFGHSPAFLNAALRQQLDLGVQVGPESKTAGRVAEAIRELTGVERVTFCNSGTEAVMAALRLARAVTGRTRIALFAGSFHGTFDGVLARAAAGAALRWNRRVSERPTRRSENERGLSGLLAAA